MESGGQDIDKEHSLHAAQQIREEGRRNDNEAFMKSFELLIWKFEKLATEPQANKAHSQQCIILTFPICHFAPMTSCKVKASTILIFNLHWVWLGNQKSYNLSTQLKDFVVK